MAVQLPKSLREYANGLQSLVAFLAEARIRQLAAEKVDFFVEGLEAGVNDCAIYAGPGTLQNRGGAAHTLFVQLPSHRGEKVFGPLDLKLCTARSDSKKGIQFAIHINPGQRLSCQAIIIVSPKEPDFAILVPLIYLPERNSEIRETVVLSSFRPLWTLYPLPAFPPEYTPFIFPLAWVQSALEDMQAYFNRSSDLW